MRKINRDSESVSVYQKAEKMSAHNSKLTKVFAILFLLFLKKSASTEVDRRNLAAAGHAIAMFINKMSEEYSSIFEIVIFDKNYKNMDYISSEILKFSNITIEIVKNYVKLDEVVIEYKKSQVILLNDEIREVGRPPKVTYSYRKIVVLEYNYKYRLSRNGGTEEQDYLINIMYTLAHSLEGGSIHLLVMVENCDKAFKVVNEYDMKHKKWKSLEFVREYRHYYNCSFCVVVKENAHEGLFPERKLFAFAEHINASFEVISRNEKSQ